MVKRGGHRFAYVFVNSCKSQDWWYRDLIGTEHLVWLMGYENNGGIFRVMNIYKIAHINKNTFEVFQNFDPNDIVFV